MKSRPDILCDTWERHWPGTTSIVKIVLQCFHWHRQFYFLQDSRRCCFCNEIDSQDLQSLQCKHAFCGECLSQITRNKTGSFQCPMCLNESQLMTTSIRTRFKVHLVKLIKYFIIFLILRKVIPAIVGIYFNLNVVKIFCAIGALLGTLFTAVILPTQLLENTESSLKLIKYYVIYIVILMLFLA